MNDLATEETIRTAFAELRYAEPARFAPPGVDTARRTVRHRRQTGVAVAAHLAVAAVLAGGYLAAIIGEANDPSPQPAGPPTATTQPDDVLRAWAALYPDLHDPELAVRLHWALAGDQLDVGVGELSAGSGIEGTDLSRSSGRAMHPGTSYSIRVGCAGAGTVTFTYRIGERPPGGPLMPEQVGGDRHQLTAQCAETVDGIAAGAAETTVTVDGPEDWLTEWVEPDATAVADGVAPVLYGSAILTDLPDGSIPDQPPAVPAVDNAEIMERSDAAADALHARYPEAGRGFESTEEIPSPGQAVAAGAGRYVAGMSSGGWLRPGSYRLAISCVAEQGTITAIAEVRGEQYRATAQCATTPAGIEAGIGEVTFQIEEMWEGYGITYEADEAALSGTLPPVYADLEILLAN